MATIIPFEEFVRARRRDRRRRETAECVEIIGASLERAVQQFNGGPPEDRPVRARQIRQLAELLEYIVDGGDAARREARG